MQDDTIIHIRNICLNYENLILIGESLMNPVGFPNYSIDSKEFDVEINGLNRQFLMRMMLPEKLCIPYEKSYCFLTLLNSSN